MTLINNFHLLLAYTGMALHILVKIEEDRKKGRLSNLKVWFKDNIISIIISVIMIPIILLIAESTGVDESGKPILPINNLTSVLAGWQTQSIFKTLMMFAGSKLPKETTA